MIVAMLLDEMNNNLLNLIDYIDNKYSNYNLKYLSQNNINYLLKAIIRIKQNYKPQNITENVPSFFNNDTSYVIDKGTSYAICLRHGDNKQLFHDMNTITFVAIHELAHLMNISFGHDYSFWCCFKFLLENAIEIGIYQPINYKKNNIDYCGIQITYSPLFDDALNYTDSFI